MTIHEKLIDALCEEFGSEAFVHDPTIQTIPPYQNHPAWTCVLCKPTEPCDGHKDQLEVIIRDAANDVYGNFGSFADLVNQTNELDEFLLKKPGVAGLVYVMDSRTPSVKAANRAKDETGNVPKTPFEEFQTSDGYTAWRNYMDMYHRNPNSVSGTLGDLTQSVSTLRYSRYVRPANWMDYMKNRDFKEFICHYLCEAKFRTMKIPPGKWLVILGPRGLAKKRSDLQELTLEKFYSNEYMEADYETVWLTNNLYREYHVTIYSRDGDVWLANLLAHTRRIIALNDATLEHINFGGEVVVVRHWQGKDRLSYVNIGTLWRSIKRHAYNMAAYITVDPNFSFDQAVNTYVFLILMMKNDYVEGFPMLPPKWIFTALRRKLGLIGLPLISGADDVRTLRIDCDALLRLILYAYEAKFPKFAPDVEDVETSIHNLGTNHLRSMKNRFSLEKFRIATLNAYWFMQYMIASQTGKMPPNGIDTVKVDSETHSKYGYVFTGTQDDIIRNYTGVPKIGRPKDASLAHIMMQKK